MCFEAWCGAWLALREARAPSTEHVGQVVAWVISVRGYRETLRIADSALEQTAP